MPAVSVSSLYCQIGSLWSSFRSMRTGTAGCSDFVSKIRRQLVDIVVALGIVSPVSIVSAKLGEAQTRDDASAIDLVIVVSGKSDQARVMRAEPFDPELSLEQQPGKLRIRQSSGGLQDLVRSDGVEESAQSQLSLVRLADDQTGVLAHLQGKQKTGTAALGD